MQNSTYTIRKAGAAEAGEAFDVVEEYCNEIGVIVRDSRADLERYLTMERSGIWLAWPDDSNDVKMPHNTAIGCILLRPLTQIKNAGEIKRLYVRQLYRGSGVAKALLLALENYAAANEISWLYLDTKQDLQSAIQFYERSGYQRCERYNDNPQATIFMRKQLL
jgi:GNAT superfamily N-acetyltransferase